VNKFIALSVDEVFDSVCKNVLM